MLKEQIIQEKSCPLGEEQSCPYEPLLLNCDDCYANRIISLFKAEVDKLTVIDDEEIIKLAAHWNPIPNRLEGITPEVIKLRLFQSVRKAQLQHDKKTLLDLMGE